MRNLRDFADQTIWEKLMRHNIGIDLTIRFESKWHTGSGEGNLLLNRLMKRDSRNRPYIPASTLKGVIRESCEKLSRTLKFDEPSDPHQTDLTIQNNFKPLKNMRSPVDMIFGSRYEGGQLFFRDAVLTSEPPYGFRKEQSRICKYRLIGTAKDQHLFSTEYAAALIELKTKIDGWHENLAYVVENDPPYEYCILIAGILILERIGGDKSTGGGKIDIRFDSVKYNGASLPVERILDSVFEYLNPNDYLEMRGIT